MASSSLLLHPVRLRIVQALLGHRTLTTAQIAEELGDVPAGTLYRHVGILSKAGVLEVASERRVRGTVERSYVLQVEATRVAPEDLAAMPKEDHANAFMAFVSGMLAGYDRYLASGTPDLVRDGVGYSMAVLWLNDEEFADLASELQAAILPRVANGPGSGRRRRMVSTVIMPDAGAATPAG